MVQIGSQIQAIQWRALRLDDAEKLADLELAAAGIDGATNLFGIQGWRRRLNEIADLERESVAGIADNGALSAFAYFTLDPRHDALLAFLEGRVHPRWRGQGIGTALLGWSKKAATQQIAQKAGNRQQVIRIMFYDRADDAVQLYLKLGFRFQYTEHALSFDMTEHAPPQHPFPENCQIEPHHPRLNAAFYDVYKKSFITRTDNLLSYLAWLDFFIEYEDSLLDLSILAKAGDISVGYLIAAADEDDKSAFYIQHLGIIPKYRRKGIANALIAHALQKGVNAGYTRSTISVNANNPAAYAVYKNFGFQHDSSFTMYRKDLV